MPSNTLVSTQSNRKQYRGWVIMIVPTDHQFGRKEEPPEYVFVKITDADPKEVNEAIQEAEKTLRLEFQDPVTLHLVLSEETVAEAEANNWTTNRTLEQFLTEVINSEANNVQVDLKQQDRTIEDFIRRKWEERPRRTR